MANTLRFKRGLATGIPTALAGEPLFTTDTFDLYIGNGTTNTRFQKYIASGTTSQLLRGDGSLLTMPIVLTSPSNGQVLKYDGTNWVNSADAGVTGSGAAGQVTYWGSTSTITGSNNLFWDATNNRLGVNTTTPSQSLSVTTTGANVTNYVSIGDFTNQRLLLGYSHSSGVTNNVISAQVLTDSTGNLLLSTRTNNASGIAFFTPNGTTATERMRVNSDGTVGIGTTTPDSTLVLNGTSNSRLNMRAGNVRYGTFFVDPGLLAISSITSIPLLLGTNDTERMRIHAGGNVSIGSTSDNGLRFQVTGDGYFSGAVGIGTASLTGFSLLINQALTTGTAVAAASVRSTIQSNATLEWNSYQSLVGTQAATFTLSNLRHFAAQQSSFGAGSTVTNQFGFKVDGNLIGATNNFAFHSDLNSGTGRWNLYMNGSAANYLAGSLGIGSTSLTGISLAVGKNISGAGVSYGILQNGQVQSAVGFPLGIANIPSVAASLSINAYRSFYTANPSIGAGSTITELVGYYVESNFVGGTSTYAFQGAIPSGTGRWNLYMNGTASNWINGNTKIGGTAGDAGFKLDVDGTMRVSGATTLGDTSSVTLNITGGRAIRISGSLFMDYATGGTGDFIFRSGAGFTERMRLDASGNLGVGTASPDARLRVAGAINSTQAIFGNVDGRGLAISTSAIGGTNDAGVTLNARSSVTSGTFIFQTDGTERVRIKPDGQVRFVPLAAAPTTNVEAGDVYYDSTTNKLRCYNGTTWNDLF